MKRSARINGKYIYILEFLDAPKREGLIDLAWIHFTGTFREASKEFLRASGICWEASGKLLGVSGGSWELLGSFGESLRGFQEASWKLLEGSGKSRELLWSFWKTFRKTSGKL